MSAENGVNTFNCIGSSVQKRNRERTRRVTGGVVAGYVGCSGGNIGAGIGPSAIGGIGAIGAIAIGAIGCIGGIGGIGGIETYGIGIIGENDSKPPAAAGITSALAMYWIGAGCKSYLYLV